MAFRLSIDSQDSCCQPAALFSEVITAIGNMQRPLCMLCWPRKSIWPCFIDLEKASR